MSNYSNCSNKSKYSNNNNYINNSNTMIDEGAHCVNRGCVALTLISKFRVIPQLERFRFFS